MTSRRAPRGLLAVCAAGALIALQAGPAAAAGLPATPSSEWWLTGSYNYSALWPTTQGANTHVAVIGPPVDTSLPALSTAALPALSYPPNAGDIDTNGDTGTCYSTQSATLIAANGSGDAKSAFVGVAPQAKIVPITVPTMHGELLSDSASTAQAITAAVSLHVNVIDVDMPAPDSPALTQAVQKALAAGILVVAPTGDEWETHRLASSPGDIPGVLDVTAVNSAGVVPWEAGSADNPDIAAPGDNVPAINSGGTLKLGHSGTSCAAAIVAGTAALLESAHPKWTAAQVITALISTASGHGKANSTLGYGLVNPKAALAASPAAGANPLLNTAPGSPAVNTGAAAAGSSTAAAKSTSGGGSVLLIVLLCVGVLILALLVLLVIRIVRNRPRKTGYVFSEPAPYLGTGPQGYEESGWPEQRQQQSYFPDGAWQQQPTYPDQFAAPVPDPAIAEQAGAQPVAEVAPAQVPQQEGYEAPTGVEQQAAMPVPGFEHQPAIPAPGFEHQPALPGPGFEHQPAIPAPGFEQQLPAPAPGFEPQAPVEYEQATVPRPPVEPAPVPAPGPYVPPQQQAPEPVQEAAPTPDVDPAAAEPHEDPQPYDDSPEPTEPWQNAEWHTPQQGS